MSDFRNLDGWDEDEKAAMQRELAALRSDLNKCNNLSEIRRDAFYDEKSARWTMVDRVRELERENAELRKALASAEVGLKHALMMEPGDPFKRIKAITAALDAVRAALKKEAQP